MFDHAEGWKAMWTRAETLVVATTGTMTLGADAAGYTRASGSFITNGFAAGMEVVGTGWPGSVGAAGIADTPSALAIPIIGGRTVTTPAGSRSLSVGLPLDRRRGGTQNPATTTPATRPFVSDKWAPTRAADSGGIVDTGFYYITWNGLSNKGDLAMFRQMQALRDLFPPGYTFTIGSYLLRVTGDPAPNFTPPVTTTNGYDFSQLSIPWRIITASNRVA